MVPVKIECACGQKYAFDVEPVNGRMPAAVNCPSCGADGTAAANDFISQSGSAMGQLPDPPATSVAATTFGSVAPREGSGSATGQAATELFPAPVPAAAPAPAPAPMRLARAQVQAQTGSGVSPAVAPNDAGRAKLVQEARTKMTLGDSMEQVAAFLTVKGFDRAEAMDLARGFYKERAKIVRVNGIKKTVVGFVMMLVPVAAYLRIKDTGRLRVRSTLWAYGVGIAGAYFFVTGIIMILAPKSEKGTVVKE